MRISRATERRFVLGRQGLWPGRRWRGRAGVRTALRACVQVQVDPLDVVGRNHDLVFASRVVGYRPRDLDTLLYRERSAFEHGGTLFIYPMERLPLLWSELHHHGVPAWWRAWHRAHRGVVAEVREEIRTRGPLESRYWIDGKATENYRSRRVEGVALHYLWRTMDVLIHHRDANRKFYDLTERLVGGRPPELSVEETRTRSALELARWFGLSGRFSLAYLPPPPGRPPRSREWRTDFRRRLIDTGDLTAVEIEGDRHPAVLRATDLPLLETVAAGEVPREWRPILSEPEAVFLGPLDIVSARGRAKSLFGFDYVWEVYKPEAQRRWGYYVLPVLVGDRLVGRIEPTQDREHRTLRVDRMWWEPGVDTGALAGPLARGLRRTADGLGLERIRLGRIGPVSLRESVSKELRRGDR